MTTGSMLRYVIAWLGFVAMGYGLTLMLADRNAPPVPATDGAPAATSAAPEPAPEPAAESAALNDATGANVADINIALASLGGGERQLSEWAGKPLVVNFWATWCGPCRKEIPLLNALQTEYADAELSIVGVAIDELEAVTAYAEQMDFNYPVLVGEDSGYRVATAIGVTNLYVPITAFVDRSGTVTRIHTGEIHREDAEFAISEIVAR